jgi:hypothetical protein
MEIGKKKDNVAFWNRTRDWLRAWEEPVPRGLNDESK